MFGVVFLGLVDGLVGVDKGQVELVCPGVIERAVVEDSGGEIVVHLLNQAAGEA